jgi:membrane-associated phospholipid phosphatase
MISSDLSQPETDAHALHVVRFLCWLTTLYMVLAAVVIDYSGLMAIAWSTFADLLIGLSIFLIPAVYCHFRGYFRVRSAMEGVFLISLNPIIIIAFTYVAIRANADLVDAQMAAADAMLGFNTAAVTAWIDQYPTVASILYSAYYSFGYQLLLMPPLLALLGRQIDAYVLVIRAAMTGVIGSFVAALFPSSGTIHHFGMKQADLENISIDTNTKLYELFMQVRTEVDFVYATKTLGGIISFPSGHAAVAVLMTCAAWRSALLRWPVLILNIMMLIATVPLGVHYLVDIFAGVISATAVILLTNPLLNPQSRVMRLFSPGPAVPTGAAAAH